MGSELAFISSNTGFSPLFCFAVPERVLTVSSEERRLLVK